MRIVRLVCHLLLFGFFSGNGVVGLAAEDTAALVEKLRLLEARLQQVEAMSTVVEVGAIDVTIPAGETNVSVKVAFRGQAEGPVVILTGETGSAGSWVLTKTSRITERDFELNVIDNENKVRDVPYNARIGYIVLRADMSGGQITVPSKPGTTQEDDANELTWTDYRKKCGKAAQRENEAASEAVFRKEFEGRKVTWVGSVASVSESLLDEYVVGVRMQPSDSLSWDVALRAPKSIEENVLSLKEGDVIEFTAIVQSQGGTLLPHGLDAEAVVKQE